MVYKRISKILILFFSLLLSCQSNQKRNLASLDYQLSSEEKELQALKRKMTKLGVNLSNLQDETGGFFPDQCLDKKMKRFCRREKSLFITAVTLEALSSIHSDSIVEFVKSDGIRFIEKQKNEHGALLKYYIKKNKLNGILKADVDDNAIVNGTLIKYKKDYNKNVFEDLVNRSMDYFQVVDADNKSEKIYEGKVFSTWIDPSKPLFHEKDIVVNLNALWLFGISGQYKHYKDQIKPVCEYVNSVINHIKDSRRWERLKSTRRWTWRENDDYSTWYPSQFTVAYSLMRAHNVLPSNCLQNSIDELEKMLLNDSNYGHTPLEQLQAVGSLINLIKYKKTLNLDSSKLENHFFSHIVPVTKSLIENYKPNKREDFYFYGGAGYVSSDALIYGYEIKFLDFIREYLEKDIEQKKLSKSERVDLSIEKFIDYLENEQMDDGSFTKMIEVSSDMYAMHMIFLYEFSGLTETKKDEITKLLNYAWLKQKNDGSIPTYPNGDGSLEASSLMYLAAKIGGESDKSTRMKSLEEFINNNGGLKKAGFLASPYLALFGLKSIYKFPFSLGMKGIMKMEKSLPWAKVMLYPFYYLYSSKQVHFLDKSKFPVKIMNKTYKKYEEDKKKNLKAREQFLAKGKDKNFKSFFNWLEVNTNQDGTFFDYTPTTIPTLMAYATKRNEDKKYQKIFDKGIATLKTFQVQKGNDLLYQSPGEASIGESYMIAIALLDTLKDPDHPIVHKAIEFLKRVQQPMGGFGFSKNNEFFPDSDDVSNVTYVFQEYNQLFPSKDLENRIQKALRVLLTFQNDDGGFSTWEKQSFDLIYQTARKLKIAPKIVLSESIAEHTSRIILCLDKFRHQNPVIQKSYDRAVKWMLEKQLKDGSYEGTWFVNYFFGTSMAISALSTDKSNPKVKKAIDRALKFLLTHQSPDGGYSESPESFDKGLPIRLDKSSPAQTGLVVAQLLTFLNNTDNHEYKKILKPSIEMSINYLLNSQDPYTGLWNDINFTGVTFPGVEYLYYPYIQEAAPFHAIGLYRSIYLK